MVPVASAERFSQFMACLRARALQESRQQPMHGNTADHGEKRDVFPATAGTWLEHCLGAGDLGLAEARTHVMTVYRLPLMIYIRGSSFRGLGEADELVEGFFADRLGRPDFLHQWARSDRPLRRWLLVALRYYMLEQIRAKRRDGAAELQGELTEDQDRGPQADFARESARQVVREGMKRASEGLARAGMGAHWDVFVAHHVDGVDFDTLAPRFGGDARRLAVMSRTAARWFRQSLREVAAWPGADERAIDAELKSLFEEAGP